MGSSSSSSRNTQSGETATTHRRGHRGSHRQNAAPPRPPQTVHQQQPQQQAPPPPMPQHLLQHQQPGFQQRYQQQPPSAMPSSRLPQSTPQVNAEVKDAKNVEALCTIQAKSVKLVGDCIYFIVTTQTMTCDYEIHVAVRETIKGGKVIFTPNKPKDAPQRITIEGKHDDLELVAPIDLDITDQEKKYVKEYPKQIPVAIVLYYTTPTGEAMSEYTYIQVLPSVSVIKQLVGTKEGIFKVENLFGADDDDDGTAIAVVADGGSTPTVVEDDGDECVICLTDPKDTAVIPCRHLCLCRGCAETLQKNSPKCPVCRGPIDQLLHVGVKGHK